MPRYDLKDQGLFKGDREPEAKLRRNFLIRVKLVLSSFEMM